ncbi:MAG: hypothetical protein HYX32_08810 [Actinobacteria bacterium]|nr:hypothetical protein [Actinomycetota bacterium]
MRTSSVVLPDGRSFEVSSRRTDDAADRAAGVLAVVGDSLYGALTFGVFVLLVGFGLRLVVPLWLSFTIGAVLVMAGVLALVARSASSISYRLVVEQDGVVVWQTEVQGLMESRRERERIMSLVAGDALRGGSG